MEDELWNEFLGSCAKKICLECGKPVVYSGRGRPRVFCSDRCRWAYNKRKQRGWKMKEEKKHK